jgi:D-arabinose 1-dehydrogenase-like Zn-dependent alcohol dehydrogenase
MKAAVVEKFGEPLVIREMSIPTPGAGAGEFPVSIFELVLNG